MLFGLMASAGGCATTRPAPITKIVDGRVIVTRAVSPDAYEHVARAYLYEEEERWEDAAVELQRALPLDDDAAEIRAELAELFVRVGRLDDAAEQVERSISTAPTVEGYLARAHLAAAKRDRAGELDGLRSAVGAALSDNDAEAIERTHLELSDAEVGALDVAGALETVRKLETAVPATIKGRLQHAAFAWVFGELDDAEKALRGALDIEPADVDARLMLAELLAARGDVAGAKTIFEEAIERADDPLQIAEAVAGWLVQRGEVAAAGELADRTTAGVSDVDSLARASALERAAKRPDRAAELATRAEKLGATPGRAALLEAEAFAAGDDPGRAASVLLGVKPSEPEYIEARLRAAELLREDGKVDAAARALDEAAGPADGVVHDAASVVSLAIARSLVDEKRGDAVRAARRLDEALADAPDDARLVLARAAVDDRRGEWRAALALAEKLLARDPRNVEALNFAGFVAADHAADLPLATKRLQAAVALSPGSGGILDSLGWVSFRGGNLAAAGTFLEQANRLEPGDPEILGHLGDLYVARHERDHALDAYRRALARKPADKLAKEIAERVRNLEAKSAAGR
ncbi:MAG TPA: tetratricopeptide repeat protein [Polyangia bacterium]|nr:tetratricopeptide repeat protein [Polyangia bacterium]